MTPRIQPVSLEDADPETRELLGALSTLRGDDAEVLNVFRTMAQHPKLMKRWLVFANHVLTKSTLSGPGPRARDPPGRVAVRLAVRVGPARRIGRREGITDEEVARIAAGPDAPGWSTRDAAILRAVDELHESLDDLRRDLGHARSRATTSSSAWISCSRSGSTTSCRSRSNAFGVERDDGIDDPAIPFPPAAST